MGTCHCTTVEYPDAMQYTTEPESSHQFEYLTQRYYMEQEHLRKHVFPSNEVSKSGRRNSIANKTDHSFATTHYSHDMRTRLDPKIAQSEMTMYEDKYEEYILEKDSQYDSTSGFHPLSRELKEEFVDSHTTPQGDTESDLYLQLRRSLESDLYLPDEDIKKLEQYFSASDSGSTSIGRTCFTLYPNLNECFVAPNVNADKRNENSVFRKDPAKIPLDIVEESKSDSDMTESTITGWRPITAKANKVVIVNV